MRLKSDKNIGGWIPAFAGMTMLCSWLFSIPLFSQSLLQTKTFKTDFISFKLSNQWNCDQEESEYVCHPVSDVKKREAIIVVAAKIPGKDDNLKAFFEYLKKPKKLTDFEGRTVASKVNTIKYKEIQTTPWVDAIHLSSELKDFYTRYLATVKNGIAILVTYSVLQSRHSAYVAELNRMITSIEVLARPPQLAAPPRAPKKTAPKVITGDRPAGQNQETPVTPERP